MSVTKDEQALRDAREMRPQTFTNKRMEDHLVQEHPEIARDVPFYDVVTAHIEAHPEYAKVFKGRTLDKQIWEMGADRKDEHLRSLLTAPWNDIVSHVGKAREARRKTALKKVLDKVTVEEVAKLVADSGEVMDLDDVAKAVNILIGERGAPVNPHDVENSWVRPRLEKAVNQELIIRRRVSEMRAERLRGSYYGLQDRSWVYMTEATLTARRVERDAARDAKQARLDRFTAARGLVNHFLSEETEYSGTDENSAVTLSLEDFERLVNMAVGKVPAS